MTRNREQGDKVATIKRKDKRINIPTEELRDFVAEDEKKAKTMLYPRVAQTSVCDVCDMLIPLEAEVESLHTSASTFLRPQSS